MNTIRAIIVSSLIPVLTAMPSAFALQAPEEQGTAVVGHLTHVEGNLLRYIDDDEEWVPMVTDSPVGAEDLLFCEDNSKAEFIIPNNTWVRTGGNTRLHITALEQDRSEMEIDSGMARLFNKSTGVDHRFASRNRDVPKRPLKKGHSCTDNPRPPSFPFPPTPIISVPLLGDF